MDQKSAYVHLSLEDPLEGLGLGTRPFNALRRASVRTVGDLVQIIELGLLPSIRNIGQKSVVEIEDILSRVRFVDAPEEVPIISVEVVRWQAKLIEKQISTGLLHEQARIAGNSIAHWLPIIEVIDRNEAYETMANILGVSINICEELTFLLDQIRRQDYITILLSRYGFEPKTLEEVGVGVGITRERVRQISEKLEEIIRFGVNPAVSTESISNPVISPALPRMQSALLIAKDMGMDITYEQWEQSIRSSGLVGNWASKAYTAIDPIEAMIAICNLLADDNVRKLQVSDNLKYAIQLAISGAPDLPARIIHVRKTLPRATGRLIKRHARFSGGAHARWLSQEIGKELAQVKDILQGLRYRALSGNWFAPSVPSDSCEISGHDVFHHALRKMLQYCGRLPIDDICSGVRQAVSRTSFPVPPPDVMEEIMRMYGYKTEDGLCHWDGETDEDLSTGEIVIMNCLERNGPVVHHSELAQAFIDSELSFPSLHATLQRSPLFERIGTGLYKLRGRSVTRQDIGRAEAAGERIPVNPEVEYDKRGNITVSATLSVIAVGTGVILCEQFPNLSGEWDCFVRGGQSGKLCATDNEFRRLKGPFESLGCQAGDRLKFTFNTWDRTVTIEKVDV
ncbi:MAG: hypothetical protein IMY80_03180 [Chloroflexi bacterium]|nr:hypothetical protein [Chloroflexota bacterium]